MDGRADGLFAHCEKMQRCIVVPEEPRPATSHSLPSWHANKRMRIKKILL